MLASLLAATLISSQTPTWNDANSNGRKDVYEDFQQPIENRIDDLMSQLTLEEKVALIHGASDFTFGGIKRLGIGEIGMNDGPQGVRGPVSTAYPSGLAMAASWDEKLMQQVGQSLGGDTLKAGNRVLLGPGVNIMRTPLGGRNFEYMGEDPFLAGKTAAAYVRGVQSTGVAACVKHYNLNEQEFWRTTISVEADERALREIYSIPFEMAVKEGKAWTVMSAYNKVRGEYASHSSHILRDILKGEWGFDGSVISDWGAWHNDKLAIEGGCDIEMPSGKDPKRDAAIAERVRKGEISEKWLNDNVRRNLRLLFRTGALDGRHSIFTNTAWGVSNARRLAADSMVLLKNDKGTLPLSTGQLKSIAVIGPQASYHNTMIGGDLSAKGGSGAVLPPYEITPLAGLKKRLGNKVKINYAPGYEFEEGAGDPIPAEAFGRGVQASYYGNTRFEGAPVREAQVRSVDLKIASGKQVHTSVPANFSAKFEGKLTSAIGGKHRLYLSSDDGSRLYVEGRLLIDNWGDHDTKTKSADFEFQAGKEYAFRVEYANTGGKGDLKLTWKREEGSSFAEAIKAAKSSDVTIVFAGINHTYDREALGWGDVPNADKPNLELIGPQADLIKAVAAANPKTIVVLIGGSPMSVEQWHQKVPSILLAWYPGQEGGNAIADILFGDVNPSGKLPCTFGKKLTDWKAHTMGREVYPGTGNNGVVKYKDGIWIGYRHFDKAKIEPRYPFGFGLSYTSFAYSNLSVKPNKTGYEVTFALKNTGKRLGQEVAQVYCGPTKERADMPVRQLKGFAKVALKPGQSKKVTIQLPANAFAYYSVAKGKWTTDPGQYRIEVGGSSRSLSLSSTLSMK